MNSMIQMYSTNTLPDNVQMMLKESGAKDKVLPYT